MKIAVVGRGNVGRGLADLWERAGHEVTRLGREGGEVSGAEAVLLAVPGSAVADALEKLRGIEGKTVIDATNLYGVHPPEGFASNAEFVKSKTSGPTVKSFNINFASLYGRLGEARATPSNLWCGDDGAREVVERLNRDAGYEPVRVGGLEKAAAQEGMVDPSCVDLPQGEGDGSGGDDRRHRRADPAHHQPQERGDRSAASVERHERPEPSQMKEHPLDARCADGHRQEDGPVATNSPGSRAIAQETACPACVLQKARVPVSAP